MAGCGSVNKLTVPDPEHCLTQKYCTPGLSLFSDYQVVLFLLVVTLGTM
jgi:hypothetical protein